ncbi:lysophospholipase L1-like esterase [Enterococcus sp. PF1-24]|uniref:SGNH/GDSL hydrolase family protein n=1 Tax=unclassified Enterococcus TaxID=2608891 RepID=UPI00247325FE|nr:MULTISPECIES: SGNH/GDSL hydrolase family protein [unclassified Enterococcus]MDH6364726.1 lysophospholipase L1-like esterase [Enterococcus sp. PFB1-1]MDH6401798.1 lysophospholipase L1-like esterase [Enterococcus sp. PF1-24]
MPKKFQKFLVGLLFFLSVTGVSYLAATALFPKATPRWNQAAPKVESSENKEIIHYTAVGDSLTEGIGDVTQQGGFVHLLASDLQEKYNFNAITEDNYGVSGDRSDQIIKRLKKDEELTKCLAKADFITVTVGGNDLMKAFQSNFFNLTVETFDKPMEQYQENLVELFELIRNENPQAPIYVLGIYNPYYVNFPEITDLQTIFDNWNIATQEVVRDVKNSYFIPINELLYQGIDGNMGIDVQETPEGKDGSFTLNDALYDGDSFHPNNLGYQIMANAVKEKLIETENQWVLKGKE